MSIIQLVRQKTERLFGMKIFKVQSVGRCSISADKKWKKVFYNFDNQVAQIFFMMPSITGGRVAKQRTQF